MDINVKVRVESPELIDAILALAEILAKLNLGEGISSIIEDKVEATKEKEVEEKKEQLVEKNVSLEEVRKVLATKSKNGKQVEVKELIKKYGVSKLTDIHSCNYKELLELAEVL